MMEMKEKRGMEGSRRGGVGKPHNSSVPRGACEEIEIRLGDPGTALHFTGDFADVDLFVGGGKCGSYLMGHPIG